MKPSSAFRRYLPRLLLGVASICAALGFLSARVLIEGERELRISDSRFAAEDFQDAIVHARRSAAWYLPGAPHVPAAYARLNKIAQNAESRGDVVTALLAWRSVRSAAISSRFLVIPRQDQLQLANASIARLQARRTPTLGSPAIVDADVERAQREAQARVDRPRVPWIVVMCGAMASMCAGLFAVARGVGKDSAIQWGKARIGLSIFGIGALLWAIALWRA